MLYNTTLESLSSVLGPRFKRQTAHAGLDSSQAGPGRHLGLAVVGSWIWGRQSLTLALVASEAKPATDGLRSRYI